MRRILLILICLFQFLLSPKSNAAELSPVEKIALNKIVEDWSDAHNDWDLDKLKDLYASNVFFYGQQLKKEACISKISSLLKPNEVFSQNIASEIVYNQFSNNVIQATFTKKVKRKNKTTNYPSYLLFIKYNEAYLIVGESDEITDKNLKFKLNVTNIVLPSINIKDANVSINGTDRSLVDYLFVFLFFGVVIGLMGLYFVLDKRKSAKAYIIAEKIETGKNIHNKEEKTEIVDVPIYEEKSKSVNEMEQPLSNEEKGRLFENYIVNKFPRPFFDLREWRSDKISKGIYPKSNCDPDLVFRFPFNGSTKEIAVECKWRKSFQNNTIDFKLYQLSRYKQFEKEHNMPVYIVFGIDGKPESPKAIYLVPLSALKSNIVEKNDIREYNKSVIDNFYYKLDLDKLT